jgi:hypothetical protein
MWTLDTALPIIQRIAPIATEHGFTVALRGSVLTNGFAEDLDLCFIEWEVNTNVVHANHCLNNVANVLDAQHGSLTSGHALILLDDGRRIDAHFLSYTPLQGT